MTGCVTCRTYTVKHFLNLTCLKSHFDGSVPVSCKILDRTNDELGHLPVKVKQKETILRKLSIHHKSKIICPQIETDRSLQRPSILNCFKLIITITSIYHLTLYYRSLFCFIFIWYFSSSIFLGFQFNFYQLLSIIAAL